MNRRAFLAGLTATTAGVLIPERKVWALDRTMISRPAHVFNGWHFETGYDPDVTYQVSLTSSPPRQTWEFMAPREPGMYHIVVDDVMNDLSNVRLVPWGQL